LDNKRYTLPYFYYSKSPSATNVVVVVVVDVGFLLLSDFQCTKAFSFNNRSPLNFVHRFVTIFYTIAQCQIFKLTS